MDIKLIVPGWVTSLDKEILGPYRAVTADDGTWTTTLTENSLITPAGTYYEVTETVNGKSTRYEIVVTATPATQWVGDILREAPTPVAQEFDPATALAIRLKATGDTQDRYTVDASGKTTWGSGSAAGDTNLYRVGPDALQTDDSLQIKGPRPWADVVAYGADPTGVAASDAAFVAAQAAARVINVPQGDYKLTSTFRFVSSKKWIGAGSNANGQGSRILWSTDNGTPAFDSDPADYLSDFRFEGFHIKTNLGPNPALGPGGHCFKLYAVVNNSAFKNVSVQNFREDAWHIEHRNTGTDPTSLFDVLFEQCFAFNNSGYQWNINGMAQATWLMIDTNRAGKESEARGGLLRWFNSLGAGGMSGSDNASQMNWYGVVYEAGGAETRTQPILLENNGIIHLNMDGLTLSGPVGSSSIIRSITAGTPRINLTALRQLGYTNTISDEVAGITVGAEADRAMQNILYNGRGTTVTRQESRRFGTLSATSVLSTFFMVHRPTVITALNVFTQTAITASATDYWLIQLSQFRAGSNLGFFITTGSQSGWIAEGRTQYVPGPTTLLPGDMVKITVSKVGAPANLTDFVVQAEQRLIA